jgi:flagellin
MRINTNLSALNTQGRLNAAQTGMSKSLEKLSSGLRIGRASDDAAGLAISEKMRSQIKGLNRASANAQEAISLVQTAEGALNESHSILSRMKDLSVQASSDTMTDANRLEIQKEVDELSKELTRITNTTEFNTKNLLGGALTSQKFQIGSNEGQIIELNIDAMDAKSLGLTADAGAMVMSKGTQISGASRAGSATLTNGTYTVKGTITTAAAASSGQFYSDHLTITAKTAGAASDDIQFEVVAGADGVAASATVVRNAGKTIIQVTADTAAGANTTKTTLQQIKDAIDSSADASALVKVDITSGQESTEITDGALAAADLSASGTAKTTGADAEVSLKLYNSAGVEVLTGASATNASAGSAVAMGSVGLSVNLDTDAVNLLAKNDEIIATTVDVFGDSTAAVGAGDGKLTSDATVGKGILVNTQANASTAITKIDAAIDKVSAARSNLGALQNRLEHTISNLSVTAENMTAAESNIRDVDMAKEMSDFTKNQILSQAATAMLAQANQVPQGVLKLLG